MASCHWNEALVRRAHPELLELPNCRHPLSRLGVRPGRRLCHDEIRVLQRALLGPPCGEINESYCPRRRRHTRPLPIKVTAFRRKNRRAERPSQDAACGLTQETALIGGIAAALMGP